MRKVFLSTCLLVVFLVMGLGFVSQPVQSQPGRQGAAEKVSDICGGQASFFTTAPFPGVVVSSVTFDLADVGSFPGDTTLFAVDILFSAESRVTTAGTFSGVSFSIDGGPAINSGPQFFDSSFGPGWGVRTTNNRFFITGSQPSGSTVHTVDARLFKAGGAGSVGVFWRCTRADFSSLQS